MENIVLALIGIVAVCAPILLTWVLQNRTQRHNKLDHGNVIAQLSDLKESFGEHRTVIRADIHEMKADLRDVKGDVRLLKSAQIAIGHANDEIEEAYAAHDPHDYDVVTDKETTK